MALKEDQVAAVLGGRRVLSASLMTLLVMVVVLLLRTAAPAWRSRPSPLLLWSTVAVAVCAVLLPYLAPVAQVLQQTCGIKHGLMTTVHAYTQDQRLVDAPHSDMRRARSAALSMIPTSTGAAAAIGEVLPELKGKLDGMAVRVPTPNVSLVDLTFTSERPTSAAEINAAIEAASKGHLKGVLHYETRGLVSIDFNGNPHSSIFDAELTKVIDGNLIKVMSWYDNEWGFSNRMVDLACLFGK